MNLEGFFVLKIKEGSVNPETMEPVRIVEKDGKIYTLDNRRLYTHQQAEVLIRYQKLVVYRKDNYLNLLHRMMEPR